MTKPDSFPLLGPWAMALIGSCSVSGAAEAQSSAKLAPYFGFEDPRVIIVGEHVGPAVTADFNGDGLIDLACANNSKSRIEIHLQRKTARTDQEIEREYKVNELPPSRHYDRVELPVSHRVTGFRAVDVDKDGKLDIVYAGQPAEIVILRQTERMKFETLSKRRVPGLSAGQDGIDIADVMGSPDPELLAIVSGKISVFGLSSSAIVGEPVELGSSAEKDSGLVAFFIEDFNGDGLNDILGAIPDNAAPLRLWLQTASAGSSGGKNGQIGPELRFEMPPLREVEPVRVAGRAAASIGLIERPTRRIIIDDLKVEPVTSADAAGGGERDATAEVFAFPGAANKSRSVSVADIDNDGLLDLLVTDQQGNSLVLYRQAKGVGLGEGQRFSALKDPKTAAVGQWDGDPTLEVFVLSEADKTVGVSHFDAATGRLSFPQPLTLATAGASPVAMGYATLTSGPAVAVIVKDKRDHTLEVHRPTGGAPATLKLEGVNRPPQSMLSGDFDHDGKTDLLLFTPNEPLVMVRSVDGDASAMQVLTDKTMPQFGLVQSAGPDNTAMLDIDGDGFNELLIADQNFVRACAFSAEKGWRVVEQITVPDAGTAFVGLTVLPAAQAGGSGATVIAADRGNKRLVLMAKGQAGAWGAVDRLRFSGFDIGAVYAGSFTGDGQPNILATSDAAFAIVRLSGQRVSLEEVTAYRSDSDDRLEHEIEVGDLNSDGYTDLVVLDAQEQMCQIFTLSASRKLLLATEFEVFESRRFTRGEDREFEPSAAIIADLTGDGAPDLVLQVHDRYVIYPQMTKPK